MAIDGLSAPRQCGGDIFYVFFQSGPERVMPSVTDHCNGTYTVNVRIAAAGNYVWKVVHEWQHDEGIDERLDPPIGGKRSAIHAALVSPLVLRALAPPTGPYYHDEKPRCQGLDHDGRYVNVSAVAGKAQSLMKGLKKKNPSLYMGIDATTAKEQTWAWRWQAFDCSYKHCSAEQTLRSLLGRTVLFVGSSVMRQLYMNFIQMSLGQQISSQCQGEARCLCHGVFEFRWRLSAHMNSSIGSLPAARLLAMKCHENRLAVNHSSILHAASDEVLVLFTWFAGVNCSWYKTSIKESDCSRVSGDEVQHKRILDIFLPRADFVAVTIGMHPVMRAGTRGCLESFHSSIDYFTQRTRNARYGRASTALLLHTTIHAGVSAETVIPRHPRPSRTRQSPSHATYRRGQHLFSRKYSFTPQ
jgi:hypothetical protein